MRQGEVLFDRCVTYERFSAEESPYDVAGIRIYDAPMLCSGEGRYWVRRVTKYFFNEEIAPTVHYEVLGVYIGLGDISLFLGKPQIKAWNLPFCNLGMRENVRQQVIDELRLNMTDFDPKQVVIYGFDEEPPIEVVEIET
jgi:hypothetical protein